MMIGRHTIGEWIALSLTFCIVGMVVLLVVNLPEPCGCGDHRDASAQSAGRNAAFAQAAYYHLRQGAGLGTGYASDLESLLAYDPDLNDDGQITFIFGAADQSGFIYTTQHAESSNTYIFTQSDPERMQEFFEYYKEALERRREASRKTNG